MIIWGLTEVELLAFFFASSAVLILIGLRLLIGPTPEKKERNEFHSETIRPRRIDAVEEEGYEIIEIYNDNVSLSNWFKGYREQSTIMPATDAVRTAKIRDPGTGRVHLIHVLDRVRRSH
jgi:hypothetical protein